MSKKSWVPTQYGWEEINEDDDQDQEYFPYVEDVNDYDYDEDEHFAEIDLEEENPEKREDADFWAARGKKEDADFWATRG